VNESDRPLSTAAEPSLEERLAASEHRFQAMFEQFPMSIQMFTPDGRTRAVNAAWARLWQVPPELIENFILKDYRVLEDPQLEAKGITPYLRRAFAGEAQDIPPVYYDPAEIGKDGRPRWTSAHAYPVRNPDGRISDVVLVHQDVTELREAVAARDALFSVAAHDLQTPITALLLQLQMAKRINDPEQTERSLDVAIRQTRRLSEMIEQLMDVSRIRSGHMVLERTDFDLAALAEDVVDRLAPQAAEANCTVELDLDEVRGSWDRTRLEQVVTNLLVNATKYAPGGPIRVRVHARQDTAILRVTDSGPGIPADKRERIFDRYERGEPESKASGLGLGLFIVKQIVQLHGGSVRVETGASGGAEFVVEIPRKTPLYWAA
jgi:signal transduction histidine kinase